LTASENQGDKLRQRIGIALEKSGVAKDKIQRALEFPGTALEDEIVATIIKFSKQVSGIITPVSAIETGFVPNGWSLISDELEGDVDTTKLDFNFAPCNKIGSSISGDVMLERCIATPNIIGSLGFAAEVLNAQEVGRDIIPSKLKDRKCVIFPKTILRDIYGDRRVACLDVGTSGQWKLLYESIGNEFRFNYSKYVVPRVRE
jgi:hypothetical protein